MAVWMEEKKNWRKIADGLLLSWFIGLLFRCFREEEGEAEEDLDC